MAGVRLFGRWAGLLGTRSSLTASGPLCLAGRPPRAPSAALLEPPWAQALHVRLQQRALCEGRRLLRREDENPAVPKRTELDDLVEKAGGPEEVLRLWAERGATANQTAIYIFHLARLASEKGAPGHADLLRDRRLQDMFDRVSSQVCTVWNGSLVSVLRAAALLGVTPGSAALDSLQTEALWRIRRFSYRQLAYLADWACGRDGGTRPRELLAATLKQLELRWTELADVRTVGLLLSRAAHLPPSLVDKLEDKALELVETFHAEDIRRVAVSLAAQGRRSVPLLRALSYHAQQKPSQELKAPLLLDLVFAYAKMKFHQTQLFQRIATELLPQLAQLSSGDVTRCARSFAYLKWLHQPLFEGFAEHYLQQSEKYSAVQLGNLLLSFARLDFQPSKREHFYSKVHDALRGSLSQLEPYLLTDVVWSLCVLQQAKPEYLKVVLDPAFQQRLTDGGNRKVSYALKLLQVAATAHLENLCPQGAAADPLLLSSAPALEIPPTPMQRSLHAALHDLVGGLEGGCRTAVTTVYGWTVDGELVIDSDSKPIRLLGLKAPHLPGGGGPEPPPQGARRIAFLAGDFLHYGSRSKEPLGRFAMQRRHLQLAGFLTVEVPYYEWAELKSDWQRVAYLKAKMGKAVAEDMAK
ncbi:FAST kinase domain-containing protein 4 [Scleropages formosus]|nr:FAST kinase domain-containing protein 4 [Scleropages formosus]